MKKTVLVAAVVASTLAATLPTTALANQTIWAIRTIFMPTPTTDGWSGGVSSDRYDKAEMLGRTG